MISVSTQYDGLRCDAKNKSCTKEATVLVGVENETTRLCVSCARELFNALGFIICSQTGESIARLCGLQKRKGDR